MNDNDITYWISKHTVSRKYNDSGKSDGKRYFISREDVIKLIKLFKKPK